MTELFKSISGLADRLQALNKEAVREYTPIVNAILQAGSRDVRNIEHTLDGLLDFCGYEPILQLYKKLCRHYYFINPAAAAEYVNAYREMWDSEDKEESLEPVRRGGNTLECGGSTPLLGRSPRRPSKRGPRLAKQSGAKAPQSKIYSRDGGQ